MLFDLGVGSRRPQGSARPLVWGRARLRAHHRRALHAARVPADEAIYFVGAEDLVSEREVVGVARIGGAGEEVGRAPPEPPHLRPTPRHLQGARGMWGGLDASGLIEPALTALLNRRVAYLNGCEF